MPPLLGGDFALLSTFKELDQVLSALSERASVPDEVLRIVLVEDSEHDRAACRRVFHQSRHNFELHEFQNAQEASRKLKEVAAQIDAILCDYRLPGGNGLDWFTELKKRGIDLPFVLMTGVGTEQIALQALRAGVADYVVKNPDEMYTEVLPEVLARAIAADRDRRARKVAEEQLRAHQVDLRIHQEELEVQNEELRRAQLELTESRDRYADLYEFAPVGYVTIDPANRIREANLTMAAMLGMERHQLVGQALRSLVAASDATRLQQHLEEVQVGQPKASCELDFKAADGSVRRLRLDTVARGGGVRSIAFTDLTENAALLEAKKETEGRLRVISHALPIPVAYLDRSEAYQFSNDAHEEWFHVSRNSIIGRQVKDVLGESVYAVVKSRIKQAMAGRGCSCRLELSLPDGARSVEVRYAPHFSSDDEVIGCYVLMFDVTASVQMAESQAQQLQLEAEIEKLSSRQRSIFELLLRGMSNKAISHELDFSTRTVERERHDILKLLGVQSINELLVKFAGLAASEEPASETT